MKYLLIPIIAMLTACSTIKLETVKATPIYKSNNITLEDYKDITSSIIENIDGGMIKLTFSYKGIDKL